MGTNSLMVVGQPKRFGETSTPVARRAPASPMVLQHFTQLLSDLSQKVNAIAVNQEKAMVKPVESTAVEVRSIESSPPAVNRQTKVNRESFRDIFD